MMSTSEYQPDMIVLRRFFLVAVSEMSKRNPDVSGASNEDVAEEVLTLMAAHIDRLERRVIAAGQWMSDNGYQPLGDEEDLTAFAESVDRRRKICDETFNKDKK